MKRILPLIALTAAACQRPDPAAHDTEMARGASLPAPPSVEQAAQPLMPDMNTAQGEARGAAANATKGADVRVQNVGACEAAPQLKQWASRARDVADANGDGVISKAEANGALNFLVGGLFFRADANADGQLDTGERRQAKQDLLEQYPNLDQLLTSVSSNDQVSKLFGALDERTPDTIALADVRKAANGTVDQVFATVDVNSDGKITALEADQGFNKAFAAAGRFAFNQADGNNDARLTKEEFEGALRTPMMKAFEAADANSDGALTETEAASMMAWVSERVDTFGERGYSALSGLMKSNADSR